VWAADLQQRFGGRPIAVILEQSRGALVYMLTKYPRFMEAGPLGAAENQRRKLGCR
jgi:hypothetical protein